MAITSTLRKVRQKALLSIYQRRVLLLDRGPIVSFTFDDFPRTALITGGEILKAYGARGTYYAATGLMGTTNELGDQFRREDLDVLLKDGHELASHTRGHVSCRSTSSARFGEEVKRGRKAIEELIGQRDCGNFAFPYGEVTLGAKRAAAQNVASSRGIWGGLNGPVVDLNLLRANNLYGDRAKAAQIQELVLENELRKSWLIFYTHDVQPTPSRFGCTPELLEFAVSIASQSSARILTIAEVIAELMPSHAENPS